MSDCRDCCSVRFDSDVAEYGLMNTVLWTVLGARRIGADVNDHIVLPRPLSGLGLARHGDRIGLSISILHAWAIDSDVGWLAYRA